MTLPDFKMPIEDRNAADFWLDSFKQRFEETNDYAYKEAADDMRRYIADYFTDDEEDF